MFVTLGMIYLLAALIFLMIGATFFVDYMEGRRSAVHIRRRM